MGKLYWRENRGISGFREFPNTDWWMGVDSGPVIAGFGVAATAFGAGAARANNRFDDAYTLGSEIIAFSWPLLDGTLLSARLLSNFADAPYLGETNLLFLFTRQPKLTERNNGSREMPAVVYAVILLYFLIGFVYIRRETIALRKWLSNYKNIYFANPSAQFILWLLLILTGTGALFFYSLIPGVIIILISAIFPIGRVSNRMRR